MAISIKKIIYFSRLNPAVGAVYVAMRRCLSRVASFMATYMTVTLAFALGLHFIFKDTVELCKQEAIDMGIEDYNATCVSRANQTIMDKG